MFINIRLVILFDMFLNPTFKMTSSFTNNFSYEDPIPDYLKSFLVYKFTHARCSSSYIAETCRHFKTRIEEHNKKDDMSHVY